MIGIMLWCALQLPTNEPAERIAEARLLAFDGHYQEALELFRSSLAFAPKDPVLQYYIGITLFKLARFKPAKLYFRRAIELQGPFPEPFLWLAKTALELGHEKEAGEVLLEGLERFPGHEGLLELKAQMEGSQP